MKLTATFHPSKLSVSFDPKGVSVSTGNPITRDYVERDPYEGAYEITPSEEAQTLQTRNLRMTDNVTVNAIPTNYGRIAWDGRIITVY